MDLPIDRAGLGVQGGGDVQMGMIRSQIVGSRLPVIDEQLSVKMVEKTVLIHD